MNIQLEFTGPTGKTGGIASLRMTFASHLDEQVVKEIAEALRQRELVPAIYGLIEKLSTRMNLYGAALGEVVWGLANFMACAERHEAEYELLRHGSTYEPQRKLGTFTQIITFEFRPKPRPDAAVTTNAPSWAHSGKQDPGAHP